MQIDKLDKSFPFKPAIARSKGVHVSEIIRSIMIDLYGDDRTMTNETRMKMDAGFCWEEALSIAWGQQLGKRPGEIIVDGIAGSPDGIKEENGNIVVEEYKFTSYSAKKDITENMRWMMQLKAYCNMLNTAYAEMHILFINGDYKHPFAPQYHVYAIEFSVQELVENWSMICNHAKQKGMIE